MNQIQKDKEEYQPVFQKKVPINIFIVEIQPLG